MPIEFQTRFKHKPVRLASSRPSKVRSEFKDDCDIRNIILRHSMVPAANPQYVDMTAVPDGVQGVLEFARRIAADFDNLPLKARQKFDYDPQALCEFLLDSANREEAIALGLIAPAPVTTPPPAPSNKE